MHDVLQLAVTMWCKPGHWERDPGFDLHSWETHCAFIPWYLNKSCTKYTIKESLYICSVLPPVRVRLFSFLLSFYLLQEPLFSSGEREGEQLCSRNREKRLLPEDGQDGGNRRGFSYPESLLRASSRCEAALQQGWRGTAHICKHCSS